MVHAHANELSVLRGSWGAEGEVGEPYLALKPVKQYPSEGAES